MLLSSCRAVEGVGVQLDVVASEMTDARARRFLAFRRNWCVTLASPKQPCRVRRAWNPPNHDCESLCMFSGVLLRPLVLL
jgi:hypothetical protein